MSGNAVTLATPLKAVAGEITGVMRLRVRWEAEVWFPKMINVADTCQGVVLTRCQSLHSRSEVPPPAMPLF